MANSRGSQNHVQNLRKTTDPDQASALPYVQNAARIVQILSDASLFGDGPPHWQQGRNNEPAQTAVEADRQFSKVQRFIRKHASEYPVLTALGLKLANCSSSTPCTSAACPRCTRALQRWLVTAASELAQDMAAEGKALRCVSVVPTRAATSEKPASASAGTVRNARIRLRRGFDAAGISLFVGASDFSFNERHGSTRRGSLSVHVWGLADEAEVRAGRRTLRSAFPAEGSTTRPVKTYTFDSDPRAIAYAFKSDFTRRVALTGRRRHGVKPASCRNTRNRQLRVEQKAMLWAILDELGLLRRLILRGVEIAETIDGFRLRRSRQATVASPSDEANTVDAADAATVAEPAMIAPAGKLRS